MQQNCAMAGAIAGWKTCFYADRLNPVNNHGTWRTVHGRRHGSANAGEVVHFSTNWQSTFAASVTSPNAPVAIVMRVAEPTRQASRYASSRRMAKSRRVMDQFSRDSVARKRRTVSAATATATWFASGMQNANRLPRSRGPIGEPKGANYRIELAPAQGAIDSQALLSIRGWIQPAD
jgi:hypothetical protein